MAAHPDSQAISGGSTRLLRAALAFQVVVGLLWGISMTFFARQIVLSDASGPHLEKLMIEGAAHLMLVVGAILVWRDPVGYRGALVLMIVLNVFWTIVDLVAIPMFHLSEIDFVAKLIVSTVLAVGLTAGGRRAGVL